ncbi:hypothetical protein TSUD_242370 [Trifolium subterraneum]|uniref:Uncharacterized protein n=1 Tax=Trifolium subterraneum TaxID=3900 RepID=A0A2Z6NZI3_TRISU|nr:hypothetical protein TSUD_242370 [Trifolium subterraneum]
MGTICRGNHRSFEESAGLARNLQYRFRSRFLRRISDFHAFFEGGIGARSTSLGSGKLRSIANGFLTDAVEEAITTQSSPSSSTTKEDESQSLCKSTNLEQHFSSLRSDFTREEKCREEKSTTPAQWGEDPDFTREMFKYRRTEAGSWSIVENRKH